MPSLLPASTDVGDVSWVVPTARCLGACFALGTPFHSWQLVAQGKSSIAHKGMLQIAKVMAATAAALYASPSLLEQAKAELREQSAGETYVCPIPDDVLPPVANEGRAQRGSMRGSFPVQYTGGNA
jgi:Metal-dependent amidase/aminoacylase/carboxypeptidase